MDKQSEAVDKWIAEVVARSAKLDGHRDTEKYGFWLPYPCKVEEERGKYGNTNYEKLPVLRQ